jgi:hypothetical protein
MLNPCPLDPQHPPSRLNLVHPNAVPRIVGRRSRLRLQRHDCAIDALNVWPRLCPRVCESVGHFLDARTAAWCRLSLCLSETNGRARGRLKGGPGQNGIISTIKGRKIWSG